MKVDCVEFLQNHSPEETTEELIQIYSDIEPNLISKAVADISLNDRERCEINILWDCVPWTYKKPEPQKSTQLCKMIKRLQYRYVLAILELTGLKESIIAVSFHNCHHEPAVWLHVLLYLLKELRQVLKEHHPTHSYPILLAGDFNMDVFSYNPSTGRWGVSDYLLEPYNPQPYPLTACRKDRIDHIMLWEDDGDVTCTLGEVRAHVIDIPPDINVHEPDCDLAWRLAGPQYQRDEAWIEFKRKCKLRGWVSNHDPLTTTLKVAESFSIVNWNLSKGNQPCVLPPKDLLFLQESPMDKDVQVCISDSISYSVQTCHNNRIYFKNERFERDEGTDEYLEEAYFMLQFKLNCITTFNEYRQNRDETAKVMRQRYQAEGKNAIWITEQVKQNLNDKCIDEIEFLGNCCRGIPQSQGRAGEDATHVPVPAGRATSGDEGTQPFRQVPHTSSRGLQHGRVQL